MKDIPLVVNGNFRHKLTNRSLLLRILHVELQITPLDAMLTNNINDKFLGQACNAGQSSRRQCEL